MNKIFSSFTFYISLHARAWCNQGKGFEILSNVTKHEEILKTPEMHVHHGFEGKRKPAKRVKKQKVVQTCKIEYN